MNTRGVEWLFLSAMLCGCGVDDPAKGDGAETEGVETDDVGADEAIGQSSEALAVFCPNKGFNLKFRHSGKCLAPAVFGNHARVEQHPCNCTSFLRSWDIYSLGPAWPNRVAIGQEQPTNYCLDRPWNWSANNTLLQTFPCHFDAAQQWDIRRHVINGNTFWQLEAPGTGQCLDVWGFGFANGDDAQMYACKPAGDPLLDNQLIEAPW